VDKRLRAILGGDVFHGTSAQRSQMMRRVKSTRNKSTEWALRMALVRDGIKGWQMHRRDLQGRPDFYFPKRKLSIFVDGCFWHMCPRCGHVPGSRREFWEAKLNLNRARDRRNNAQIKREGGMVIRIWEHSLKTRAGIERSVSRIVNKLD